MSRVNTNSTTNSNTNSESVDLWRQILQECSRQTSQLPAKHLLLLGDRNSGKTSLLNRLQQRNEQEELLSKGIALDYTFLEVFDDDSDDVLGRTNIWQLEGESQHIDLLSFAINQSNIQHSAVMITLDLSEPWGVRQRLETWLQCIDSHVSQLRLPAQTLLALREANTRRFMSYAEPVVDAVKRAKQSYLQISKRKNSEDDEDEEENNINTDNATVTQETEETADKLINKEDDLPEGVLIHNTGIPIIVVCCKSDVLYGALGQRYHITDDQLDYIQQYLRRICLQYGAGLVYTSSTRESNCQLLQDYIEHLLYGFDFTFRAQLAERDALFIPIGWDSLEKIQLDFDTQRACSDVSVAFEEVIKKPSSLERNGNLDLEDVEEFQEFLARHKSTLEKREFVKAASHQQQQDGDENASSNASLASPAPTTRDSSVLSSTPSSSSAHYSDFGSSASPTPASPMTPIPNTDMIQNFFQSLLEGSSGQAPGIGSNDEELMSQLERLRSPKE